MEVVKSVRGMLYANDMGIVPQSPGSLQTKMSIMVMMRLAGCFGPLVSKPMLAKGIKGVLVDGQGCPDGVLQDRQASWTSGTKDWETQKRHVD